MDDEPPVAYPLKGYAANIVPFRSGLPSQIVPDKFLHIQRLTWKSHVIMREREIIALEP